MFSANAGMGKTTGARPGCPLPPAPITSRETLALSAPGLEMIFSGVLAEGDIKELPKDRPFSPVAVAPENRRVDGSKVDAALLFLKDHEHLQEAAAAVDLSRLRRKVDLWIVPIMFLCYTMHFVDRSLLNVRYQELSHETSKLTRKLPSTPLSWG